MKKKLLWITASVVVLTLLSGLFVPRNNPPIESAVAWDSPETQARFRTSCADCHSHETKWPWYSYIGPSAFLVWNNVTEGREHFNISLANMGDADEAGEEVAKGNMPPSDYLLLHGDAAMTAAERDAFAKGLVATFGQKSPRDQD